MGGTQALPTCACNSDASEEARRRQVSMDPVTCMPDSDQKPSAPASGSRDLAASDKQLKFEAVLNRTGAPKGPVGVDVTWASGPISIAKVTGGMVGEWNASHPERSISVGDVICEVNGSRSNRDIMKKCAEDEVLQVQITKKAALEAERKEAERKEAERKDELARELTGTTKDSPGSQMEQESSVDQDSSRLQPVPAPIKAQHFRIIVVGGGNAAGYICRELVQNGVGEGEVAVLTNEPVAPYERPALTKAYLHPPGSAIRARLPAFHTCAGVGGEPQTPAWYAEKGITFLSGTATGLDVKAKAVEAVAIAQKERYTYDKLVLATGAKAERMSVPGNDLQGVFHVRNEQHAAGLVKALEEMLGKSQSAAGANKKKKEVAIVGGGYLSCEVAAAVVGWGFGVTMVTPYKHLGPKVLKGQLAYIYEDMLRARGIKMAKLARVVAFEGTKEGVLQKARLNTGKFLNCGLAVIGIGSFPSTDFVVKDSSAREQPAEAKGDKFVASTDYCSGLDLDESKAVLVDGMMRTSAQDVWAVGDMVSFPSRYGGRSKHLHVDHARKSSAQAVQSLLGLNPKPYDYLPYFYHRIFEYTDKPLTFHCFGNRTETQIINAENKDRVQALFLHDGVAVGILLMGSPGANPQELEKMRAFALRGEKVDPKSSAGEEFLVAAIFEKAGL